jgi:hypothetical protein
VRTSLNQVYKDYRDSSGKISSIFGQLTQDGTGLTSCGRWEVSYNGKTFDVHVEGNSILSDDGVPYTDHVRAIGNFESELAVDLGSHIVRLEDSVVIRAFDRTIPMQKPISIRYLRHNETKRLALHVEGFSAPLIDVDTGNRIESATQYHIPCADIPSRRITFSRPIGSGEIQLTQQQSYGQQDRLHIYKSSEIFSGSQLSLDRVKIIGSHDGAVFLSYEPDSDGHVPQVPTIWPGARNRNGPQLSVETFSSLGNPWSEPRSWKIDDGRLYWYELGYRWGD